MKASPPKSAYLGWLAGALAEDRPAPRLFDAPDDLVLVVDGRPDVLDLLETHGIDAVHPDANAGWEPHPVMAPSAGTALRSTSHFPLRRR